MSAIGMPANRGKGFVLSSAAEYRHDLLFFERQQSPALRALEWEERVRPLMPWSAILLRGIGVTALASAALMVLI